MQIPELHRYSVGELYSEKRRRWPEGAQFLYRRGQFEFLLFFNRPRGQEVLDVRKGEARFALLPYRDTLFFLYRFGTNPRWSDATFSWWLHEAEERQVPIPPQELAEESRIAIPIMLVGADDGLIKAMRLVTFSPSFTAELFRAVRKQASQPWCGDEAYAKTLRRPTACGPRPTGWPRRQQPSAVVGIDLITLTQ
ncbi:MAG TPA: hypothetical protein VIL39_05400 [Verrucomicrobiae bacterium]